MVSEDQVDPPVRSPSVTVAGAGNDDSAIPLASALLSSSQTKMQSFSAISEKLDSENYLLWEQQVEPVIKAHQLHHFLVNPTIPPKFLIVDDCSTNTINPECKKWEQQDQLLLAWLQSTISCDMLTRVIGSKHSWQLWDKVHAYFQTHTQAKSRQLRSELRSTTLENKTVSEFLLKIQSLVNSLSAIGEPIIMREHLDVILEGLPQDYVSTMSIICGKFGPISIAEAETLLLGHEARLDRFRKSVTPSVNLTQSSTASNSMQPNAAPQENVTQVVENSSESTFSGYRGGRGGRDGRFAGRGRGRGGRGSVQCQVCHKHGQDASVCFHRFKRDFVPSIPLADPAQNSAFTAPWINFAQSFNPSMNSYSAMTSPPAWPYSAWNYYGPPRAAVQPSMYSLPQMPQVPQFLVMPQPVPQVPPMLGMNSAFQPRPQALIANTGSAPSASWYPDLGASHHVTSQAQNIQQLSPFEGPEQILIGNGQGFQ